MVFTQILAAAFALVAAHQEEPAEAVDLKLVDAIVGTDSLMTTPEIDLIRTPEAWQNAWAAHRGAGVSNPQAGIQINTGPAPAVDFEKNIVLAVFAGEVPSAGNYVFVGAQQDDRKGSEHGVIRIAVRPIASPGITLQTRPFAFFMLTRYPNAIEVQMPRTQAGSNRTEWMKVAEFPAVKNPKKEDKATPPAQPTTPPGEGD